ncbi:MAG: hypothetical protein HZB23_12595 [Deltaproteobacteria bacterium]|nr:hypothetical protein [Deltaproteobacteria bacterium]
MTTESRLSKAVAVAEWVLNIGVLAYAVLFLATLWRGGALFEFRFMGVNVSASDPGKPLAILFFLLFLRFCLSLEKKNLALLVSSIVFSLFLGEGFLRLWPVPIASQSALSAWRRPSPLLGYELIPGLSYRASARYDVEINSHGLRDRERTWKKPEGVRRLVCLGDSFTFGMGLDIEDTYVRRLEGLLTGSGIPVDVVNGGVIGYNIYQSLTWFKETGIRYEPDLVIYFFFMDDAEGCTEPNCIKNYYENAMSGKDRDYRPSSTGLPFNSHLVNFIVNVYAQFSARLRYLTVDWVHTVEGRKEHFDRLNRSFLTESFRVAAFSDNLMELDQAVNAKGAKFLVVLVPDAAQLNNPPMQNTNRVLEGLCRDAKIAYLDLTAVFEKEPDVSSLYLFPVDAHTSAKGDALAAQAVRRRIIEDNLLAPTSP